ncbi:hypothetical protein BG004_007575 [Podila humilis]|nr:hypothetical protein BG004_007575 [Podila humilis]
MTDTHPNQRNLLQELIEYIFSPGSSTRTPTTVAPPPVPTCKRIGCKKPRYSIFDHCSRTCYRVSLMPNAPRCARPACSSRVYIENGTKISKDGMKNLSYDYCSKKCYHKHSAEVSQPTLMFLSSNNYDYNVVQKKVAGQIVINRLARIVYPSQLATRHHAFGINLKIKTSNLKFHGTGLSCSKLSSSGVVCGQAHCKACGIVSNGLCNSCVVRESTNNHGEDDNQVQTGHDGSDVDMEDTTISHEDNKEQTDSDPLEEVISRTSQSDDPNDNTQQHINDSGNNINSVFEVATSGRKRTKSSKKKKISVTAGERYPRRFTRSQAVRVNDDTLESSDMGDSDTDTYQKVSIEIQKSEDLVVASQKQLEEPEAGLYPNPSSYEFDNEKEKEGIKEEDRMKVDDSEQEEAIPSASHESESSSVLEITDKSFASESAGTSEIEVEEEDDQKWKEDEEEEELEGEEEKEMEEEEDEDDEERKEKEEQDEEEEEEEDEEQESRDTVKFYPDESATCGIAIVPDTQNPEDASDQDDPNTMDIHKELVEDVAEDFQSSVMDAASRAETQDDEEMPDVFKDVQLESETEVLKDDHVTEEKEDQLQSPAEQSATSGAKISLLEEKWRPKEQRNPVDNVEHLALFFARKRGHPLTETQATYCNEMIDEATKCEYCARAASGAALTTKDSDYCKATIDKTTDPTKSSKQLSPIQRAFEALSRNDGEPSDYLQSLATFITEKRGTLSPREAATCKEMIDLSTARTEGDEAFSEGRLHSVENVDFLAKFFAKRRGTLLSPKEASHIKNLIKKSVKESPPEKVLVSLDNMECLAAFFARKRGKLITATEAEFCIDMIRESVLPQDEISQAKDKIFSAPSFQHHALDDVLPFKPMDAVPSLHNLEWLSAYCRRRKDQQLTPKQAELCKCLIDDTTTGVNVGGPYSLEGFNNVSLAVRQCNSASTQTEDSQTSFVTPHATTTLTQISNSQKTLAPAMDDFLELAKYKGVEWDELPRNVRVKRFLQWQGKEPPEVLWQREKDERAKARDERGKQWAQLHETESTLPMKRMAEDSDMYSDQSQEIVEQPSTKKAATEMAKEALKEPVLIKPAVASLEALVEPAKKAPTVLSSVAKKLLEIAGGDSDEDGDVQMAVAEISPAKTVEPSTTKSIQPALSSSFVTATVPLAAAIPSAATAGAAAAAGAAMATASFSPFIFSAPSATPAKVSSLWNADADKPKSNQFGESFSGTTTLAKSTRYDATTATFTTAFSSVSESSTKTFASVAELPTSTEDTNLHSAIPPSPVPATTITTEPLPLSTSMEGRNPFVFVPHAFTPSSKPAVESLDTKSTGSTIAWSSSLARDSQEAFEFEFSDEISDTEFCYELEIDDDVDDDMEGIISPMPSPRMSSL